MNRLNAIETMTPGFKRYGWALAAAWAILVAASLWWNVFQVRKETVEAACIQARSAIGKDVIYRRWNAMLGGVYVPVTERTPPNPYLADVPERDIQTPSGKRLTLMNPAYMTRHAFELGREEYGVHAHITSLKPVRPENAPDPWEIKALQAFELGESEIHSVDTLEAQNYLRLMRPLMTERSCLLCHAQQGYKENDIRGGISVAVPMQPLLSIQHATIIRLVSIHALLWLLGIGGITFGTVRLSRSDLKRRQGEEALRQARDSLEQQVRERTVDLVKTSDALQAETDNLRQIEQTLRASEAKYLDLYENAPAMFASVDAATAKILQCNQAAALTLGYSKEEIIGRPVFDLYHPDCLDALKKILQSFTATGEVKDAELQLRRKDGSRIDVNLNVSAVRDAQGRILHSRSIWRDITEHKRIEGELHELNRKLQAISGCNQILIHATNETNLLDKVCRLVVEVGGYRMAWVGFAEQDDAKRVRPMAQAGFEEGYIETTRITWADTDRGIGPTGTAIRTGRPCSVRNILTDAAYAPWRADALKRGYASSIALPLTAGGKTFGALNLYSDKSDAFDTEEKKLLTNLADNLAYGITALRTRVEHARVETEIRESNVRLAEAQRIAHVGSWNYSKAGRIEWSDEMYRIYGVEPDTFSPDAESFLTLIHPDDRPAMQAWIEACLSGEKPGKLVFRSILPDGAIRWISGHGEQQYDPEKRQMFMTGTAHDITERKQTEEALQQLASELAVLNTVSTQVSRTLSVERVISEAVQGALRATQASAAFLLMRQGDDLNPAQIVFSEPGRKFAEFPTHKLGECLCGMAVSERRAIFSADIYNDMRCTWEECKQAGLHSAVALPLFHGDEIIAVLGLGADSVRDFEAQAEFLETLASQVANGLQNALLHQEISRYATELEQRVAERTEELAERVTQVETLNQEMVNLLQDLQEANQRLQALDRLKSMFIASMSHELRTPLNSIIGFTGIILQGLSGEINAEQRDQLKRVYRSGKHLLALINDVIDISKIEAGKIDIRVEMFALDDVIQEAVSLLKPEIEKKGLDLRVSIPSGVMLRTDRKRLLQCILNYLNNALKYTERGGITLNAGEIDGLVEISVTDTGIGIEERDMSEIFEPFVRIDSPLRTVVLGTGLGLYLTKKLATEALQGSVSVKSHLGKGSTFFIKIPKDIDILK